MEYSEIIDQLESLADPEAVKGMALFGITPERAYGVSMPTLRSIAKAVGKDHELAGWLWRNGSREARILASVLIHRPIFVHDSDARQAMTIAGLEVVRVVRWRDLDDARPKLRIDLFIGNHGHFAPDDRKNDSLVFEIPSPFV